MFCRQCIRQLYPKFASSNQKKSETKDLSPHVKLPNSDLVYHGSPDLSILMFLNNTTSLCPSQNNYHYTKVAVMFLVTFTGKVIHSSNSMK